MTNDFSIAVIAAKELERRLSAALEENSKLKAELEHVMSIIPKM